MNKKWLISASLLLMLASCAEDELAPLPDNNEPVISEETDPEKISLRISAPSVIADALTRGTGTVGDTDAELNKWNGDSVYIYAINVDAYNLTKDTVNADYGIPTFLLGNLENFGAVATAPVDSAAGILNLITDNGESPYYSLNGAYNFLGYYVGDAKKEASITPDESAIRIDVTYDGTQDIMTAKAELTDADKQRMIKGMINSGQLDGTVEDYFDHGVLCKEVDLITKEFRKAFSSYSSRRGVRPEMKFQHELTRLTFTVAAGDSSAIVTDAGTPTLHIASYEERPYSRDEFFQYKGACYQVTSAIILPTAAELFFGEDENAASNRRNHLSEIPFFSEFNEYQAGERVIFDNRLFRFSANYDGSEEPKWDEETARHLSYLSHRTYHFGDPVIHDGQAFICPEEIPAEENTSWKSVAHRFVRYEKGVHIAKVELLDVVNNGYLLISKDSISFQPGDSTSCFTLMQRDTAYINQHPGQHYPNLIPLTPTAPDSVPTRVGESMIVTPAKDYWIKVTTQEFVDSKGRIIEPRYATQYLPPTKIRLENGFEAGKSYNVTIKVTSLQTVEVNASLEKWIEDDSKVEIDTGGDTSYDAGRLKDRNYFYFGASDALIDQLPDDSKFNFREMQDTARITWTWEQIFCQENFVHWLALPQGYKITSLTGVTNLIGKSYLDEIQDGGKFIIDEREPYQLFYLKYPSLYKETYMIEVEKISEEPEESTIIVETN